MWMCRYVLCCDVRYDFRMETIFYSSVPPVVCPPRYSWNIVALNSISLINFELFAVGVMSYLCYLCYFVCVKRCPTHIVYMNNMNNMTDVIQETWTPCPWWTPGFTPGFLWVRVAHLSRFVCCVSFCLSSSCVLCVQCCQCLWIVYVELLLRFSVTFICPVSCVSNVASVSGLSMLNCSFGFL